MLLKHVVIVVPVALLGATFVVSPVAKKISQKAGEERERERSCKKNSIYIFPRWRRSLASERTNRTREKWILVSINRR